MKVFNIAELALDQYHGIGHALVAVSNNEVIKIAYLSDFLLEEYYPSGSDELGEFTDDDLKRFVEHPTVQKVGKNLARYGSVHFGMISGYQFIEL